MSDDEGNRFFFDLFEKLIDKSKEQEHIPFIIAVLCVVMWGIYSAIYLTGRYLLISLIVLGLILLGLYYTYTRYGKRKEARKLLFNEILDYFKSNLDSKKYIKSSDNPELDVVGVKQGKDKIILIIDTHNINNDLKKNLVFDLIRIDKEKYDRKFFEFSTPFAYVKIIEVDTTSQVQLIEVIPTEKNYYKTHLKQLKDNKTTAIKNWKIKCHIEEEFVNASLKDLENAYTLLLKIRNAEG